MFYSVIVIPSNKRKCDCQIMSVQQRSLPLWYRGTLSECYHWPSFVLTVVSPDMKYVLIYLSIVFIRLCIIIMHNLSKRGGQNRQMRQPKARAPWGNCPAISVYHLEKVRDRTTTLSWRHAGAGISPSVWVCPLDPYPLLR